MDYINLESQKDTHLLEQNQIDPSRFKQTLDIILDTNQSYFKQSGAHEHFFKMLNSSDMMLDHYPRFRSMPPKEKQEWKQIRDSKIGDRGVVNRFLLSQLKAAYPKIYSELIKDRFNEQWIAAQIEPLELSAEVDALLLSTSIPAYFDYLGKLTDYKKKVFNRLRRSYINYILTKGLHVISRFLNCYESDIGILDRALLNESHRDSWALTGQIVNAVCNRSTPGHHDPLSLYAVNCLRSIYVSLFNIALEWLKDRKSVPIDFRRLLPVIPDHLDFTRERLEVENAWKRYQEHHFLFMRLSKEEKSRLLECLEALTPVQRIMWMGCLGKTEVKSVLLPMVSQTSRFEKLARTCAEISSSDTDNHPFSSQVWEVLTQVYTEFLIKKDSTPDSLHRLFARKPDPVVTRPDPEPQNETPPKAVISPASSGDLMAINDLQFLVVDDSARIRAMTIEILKKSGIHRVIQASDGTEAWEILTGQPIDVVLCDWIMPNLSGIELVQRMMQVESIAKKTAFLMLTTVNDKASIVEALSVGVRGYLIKPFTRQQLVEKVYFAVEWLRKEQNASTSELGQSRRNADVTYTKSVF